MILDSEPKENILTVFNIYKMLTKLANMYNITTKLCPFFLPFVLKGFSLDFLDLNPK